MIIIGDSMKKNNTKDKKETTIIKKIKSNNNGFSMIELLAVIVILGIISTISIVSVSRLVERSRENYYETQQKQLILAAQSYANDNKSVLPKETGSFSTVYLKELYDKKYITDKIVDQNKNECYPDKTVDGSGKTIEGSRVEIYKSSKGDYKYVGYLECYACKEDKSSNDSTCYDPKDRIGPDITIDIPDISGNVIMNKNHKITMTIKGNKTNNNIKVSSYSYKIYVDGVVRKSSGLVINNKQGTITINEDLYKYVPGVVKVVVSTVNTDGISLSKSASRDLKDAVAPQCGRVSYENANAMNAYNSGETKTCGTAGYAWVNIGTNPGTRQGWVLCNDEYGVGCRQHEYSKVFTSDGHNESIKILDRDGKEHDCSIKKCIDRTSPKITVTIKNGGTTKKTYTVNSQTSNVDYKPNDKYDTWLNKADYPNGVTITVKVEDVTSQLKSFDWKQNPKNKKENQEGNATESVDSKTNIAAASYTVTKTITDDGVRKEVITVLDNAGNKVTYTLILKIDRTPPPVPTMYMYLEDTTNGVATSPNYPNNAWRNKYVWTNTTHPVDSPDVSGWKTNQYTTTGNHGAYSNQAGNDVHVNNEGTSTIKYRSCDYAGNCSAYSDTKTIRLDRTEPNCSITTSPASPDGKNSWFVTNVKFSLNKNDKPNASNNSTGSATATYGLATTANPTNSKTSGTQSGETKSITWYSYAKDNAGNECRSSKTVKLDKSVPSCTIKVGTNGIEFSTKSDSISDIGAYKITHSNSKPNFSSSNNSLAFSDHSFYGHVENKAGLYAKCSNNYYSVKPTTKQYTRTTKKCYQGSCNTCDRCSSAGCQTKSWSQWACSNDGSTGEYRQCTTDEQASCQDAGYSNGYSCRSATCTQWNQSCSSCGCKSYNYYWGTSSNNTVYGSCSTNNINCNSSHNGHTYASCTFVAWVCHRTGYTKKNDSWCYKAS